MTQPIPPSRVDIEHWCADMAQQWREYEEREYPVVADRDTGIVEWVIGCLGNPGLDTARDVLAQIAEQHGLRLAPRDIELPPLAQQVEHLRAESDRLRVAAEELRALCDREAARSRMWQARLDETRAERDELRAELDKLRAEAERQQPAQ